MRAFLNQKVYETTLGQTSSFGDLEIYFGVRKPDEDFLFHSDFETATKARILKNLYMAFSRHDVIFSGLTNSQKTKSTFKTWWELMSKKSKTCCSNEMELSMYVGRIIWEKGSMLLYKKLLKDRLLGIRINSRSSWEDSRLKGGILLNIGAIAKKIGLWFLVLKSLVDLWI